MFLNAILKTGFQVLRKKQVGMRSYFLSRFFFLFRKPYTLTLTEISNSQRLAAELSKLIFLYEHGQMKKLDINLYSQKNDVFPEFSFYFS